MEQPSFIEVDPGISTRDPFEPEVPLGYGDGPPPAPAPMPESDSIDPHGKELPVLESEQEKQMHLSRGGGTSHATLRYITSIFLLNS